MIVWSPLAAKDYEDNIEFLLNRWTQKEAVHFIETTDSILRIIVENPLAFRSMGYKDIRAAVILPQITLYYQVMERNDLVLIRFWNNHQNPSKLTLG